MVTLLLPCQILAQGLSPQLIDQYLAEQQYRAIAKQIDVTIQEEGVDTSTVFLYYYQGKAYSQLYFQSAASLKKEENANYHDLEMVLDTALLAFAYCLEMGKTAYTEKCLKRLEGMALFMKAVSQQYFQQNIYERFWLNIQRARRCVTLRNRFLSEPSDYLTYSDWTYLAIYAAQLTERATEARALYGVLYDSGVEQEELYGKFAQMYFDLGESQLAIGTIFQGRVRYPESSQLLYRELDLYFQLEKPRMVVTTIDEQLQNFPTEQAQLHFIKGTALEQIYWSDLEKGNIPTEADYLNAEKAYLKAVALAPTIFDYAYNLAALYYNKSLNSTFTPQGTQKQQMAYHTILHKAEKALENTLNLDKQSKEVIKALEDLYQKTNQPQKLKALMESGS